MVVVKYRGRVKFRVELGLERSLEFGLRLRVKAGLRSRVKFRF